jgi:hypothetical protein
MNQHTNLERTITCVWVILVLLLSALPLRAQDVGRGQAGKGDDAVPELFRIGRVLRAAHVLGALAYSSCSFHRRVPDDLPLMRVLAHYSGPPVEVLMKMFADDPLMLVTQEKEGTIRTVERNIPTDLLNFKIHHLSFFPSGAAESDPVHGPQMAVIAILDNPEVKAFRKAHDIGPLDDYHASPGNCCHGGLVVQGELNDVTVSQALDYVLQTFPGFWIYENCVAETGERSVYFNLFEALAPCVVAVVKPCHKLAPCIRPRRPY